MRYLVLLVILLGLSACKKAETDSLSQYLDRTLASKHLYDEVKEERIAKLRNLLSIKNITPEQEYEINEELYGEFRKYKLDSAIRYMERNLSIARLVKRPDQVALSNMRLSQLYSFAGMSVEAVKILDSIRPKELPRQLLPVYYESYYRYFQHYASMSSQRSYLHEMNAYRDSLLGVLDPASYNYRMQWGNKLIEAGDENEALELLVPLLSEVEKDSPEYAKTAYSIGAIYQKQNRNEQAEKYFLLSAIADAKSAVKENASFHTLALMYYDRGDLKRAFKYTQAAIEDAVLSNMQFRTTQMSKFYSIITAAYQAEQARSNAKLQQYLILISALSLVLIILFVFVYKQIHKLYRVKEELSHTNGRLRQLNDELHDKNTLLLDANAIKEQYIARFFDLCSMYIDKMEDYRKSLNKLAQSRQMDELFKRLKSTSVMESELEELYKNFDAIFLDLYPTFVADFNALLLEDERITLKQDDLLNKELRIYALLRLGITDSVKIASFLRCSLSTVYNYRTQARNKAATSREDFEKLVMRIGSPHVAG